MNIFFYITAFFLSYTGIELFRRWTLKKKILDIPNERSSHQNPTPKGGGLIIVLICLSAYLLYQMICLQTPIWSYLIGAFIIALISWFDDLVSLSSVWRFLCHLIAASLIVWQIGFWNEIYLPFHGNISLGWFGLFITLSWIIGLTNAYNFMDGIDGLAAVQALSASLGWVFVGWFWAIDIYFFYGMIVFSASLGFLFHNWQPAGIFMGDVGSAFLGYTFAVLPLLAIPESTNSEHQSRLPLIAFLLVWLFIFDTLVTFIRRLFKKEKVWTAHRQHIYQRLVIKKYSHSTVSYLYGLLSFLICLAVIWGVVLTKFDIIVVVICLIAPITLVLLVYDRKLLTKDSQNVTF